MLLLAGLTVSCRGEQATRTSSAVGSSVVLISVDTLRSDRLKAADYSTAGFVSSMVLRQRTGIAQGFDRYEEPTSEPVNEVWRAVAQERGDVAVTKALGWLDEVNDRGPFFLFLHLFDPHTPYEAPEPFSSRYPDQYDAEVAYTDELMETFLDELKARRLYDPLVIVFLSDHGEALGALIGVGQQQGGLGCAGQRGDVPFGEHVRGKGRRRHVHLGELVGSSDDLRGILVMANEAVRLQPVARIAAAHGIQLLEQRHERVKASHRGRPVVVVVAEDALGREVVVHEGAQRLLDMRHHARPSDLEPDERAHRRCQLIEQGARIAAQVVRAAGLSVDADSVLLNPNVRNSGRGPRRGVG